MPQTAIRPILNHLVQFSSSTLDATFAAVADPTRRGILARLVTGERSISELAELFEMSLTGLKKHVQVLEAAGLVITEKVGRTRHCRIGPARMQQEVQWMESYRAMIEERLDRLGEFLERTQGENP